MYHLLTAMLTGGLWVLALARVTRFLVADRLTDFLRIWAYKRSKGADTLLTYFAQCPWCVSIWLAFATLWPVYMMTGLVWRTYPLAALAGSYIVGILAENLESADDIDVEIEED